MPVPKSVPIPIPVAIHVCIYVNMGSIYIYTYAYAHVYMHLSIYTESHFTYDIVRNSLEANAGERLDMAPVYCIVAGVCV